VDNIVQRVAMKAVIVRDGKVLILREAKTYDEGTNIGRYHMPGGRLDPGENFEDGLRREVREETGLEVELEFPVYVGEWIDPTKWSDYDVMGPEGKVLEAYLKQVK